MPSLVVSPVELTENPVEVVERKGLGHPDTICDALAEALSQNLCREYRRLFGQILHHNVDKALLCGGQAKPAFRGALSLLRSPSILPEGLFPRSAVKLFEFKSLRSKDRDYG